MSIVMRVEPNGCRHCGVGHRLHFNRYTEGVGWHRWTEPTDDQRLARMHLRRAPTCRCLTWAGDIRVPRPNGHHPLCDGTGQHRRVVLDHLHDIDAGGNCRDLGCDYNSDEAYEQAVNDYARGDGPNPYGEVPDTPECTEPRHAHTLNAALAADADPDEDPVTWQHCTDCHADDYDHGTDRGGPYCGHTAGCPNC